MLWEPERERATHESQHVKSNATRSRAHYVKNVTYVHNYILRTSWLIHELTSSSTSTPSPRCLRRRSECAYVVKLLLQLRVIFLLSRAKIARALLDCPTLSLWLNSMALSSFQKTCLSCTNVLSHTFRSHSPSLSLSVVLSSDRSSAEAAAAATSAYWFVLCLNFFQFFCCVQSRRRSAVIVVPSLCVCVSVFVRVRVQ